MLFVSLNLIISYMSTLYLHHSGSPPSPPVSLQLQSPLITPSSRIHPHIYTHTAHTLPLPHPTEFSSCCPHLHMFRVEYLRLGLVPEKNWLLFLQQALNASALYLRVRSYDIFFHLYSHIDYCVDLCRFCLELREQHSFILILRLLAIFHSSTMLPESQVQYLCYRCPIRGWTPHCHFFLSHDQCGSL